MNPSDPFEESLVYEANLALTWRPYAEDRDPDLEALNLGNEQTLRLLAAVEEFYPEAGEDHSPNHELARLETKLNLVLELLSELLASQHPQPPGRQVRLNAHAVSWQLLGEAAPDPGQRLLVEAYLSPEVPRPLRLLGRVLDDTGEASPALVTAALEPPSEQVIDLLEKFIFRHHRRAIAHSRPKARGG